MIIRYKCNRCNKETDVRLGAHEFNYKPGNQEKYDLPDVHYRLDCAVCNRLIRYIGVTDLNKMGIDLANVPITHKGRRKKIRPPKGKKIRAPQQRNITNEELNFKLDLIIEYLTKPSWDSRTRDDLKYG